MRRLTVRIGLMSLVSLGALGCAVNSQLKNTSNSSDNTINSGNTETAEIVQVPDNENAQNSDNERALFPDNEDGHDSAGIQVAAEPKKKLKVYMPAAYIDPSVIPEFEKQYNVWVTVDIFDSNEMMDANLMRGAKYDVLIPSDYMIERLIKENMLQPLDKSAITNMDQLSDEVKRVAFDPDNTYSVPYFWGNVGIVYNKHHVPKKVLETQGFAIYHNKDYAGKVYWFDSERDSYMIALKSLGYSMNSNNDKELRKAFDWLCQMGKTMNPIYLTDEVIDEMYEGRKDIAVLYSGDAATLLNNNENLAFFVPKEGTNVWVDSMVIPVNSENPELANLFINYMTSYEVSLKNTKTVGYTSPNAKAYAEMIRKGAEFENNEAYQVHVGKKDEVFHDNMERAEKTDLNWIKVKFDCSP